ncbi:FAD-dependent monooxygenase [Tropicimonas sp. IMCC34011]|uniref:FAD-dependent monooxygenase n=1 Tax=Tropicimonas sp. IMCC34011 TaxID=2248759 RepID=UPI000E230931|nr:FAD-dependent monooxygenase [Tropicimonas sp. IMCC34011]
MRADIETDILIVGAGLAGLIAAASLKNAGHDVVLASASAPPRDPKSEGADRRSTAFLLPSRSVLRRAGIEVDDGTATPLAALRIVETGGRPRHVISERTFHPDDLGAEVFGWNIPNARLGAELLDRLEALSVPLRIGAGLKDLHAREDRALAVLADGTRISARLIVGADGRDSAVRRAAGIGTSETRYGQKALAFPVRHTHPHANVSAEIYEQGGAFTTVPLPDADGRPASAIVWMADGPEAIRLAALSEAELAAEATERSCGLLGTMTPLARPGLFPVVTRIAERLASRRVALIAEAAHVLPPIGAQGLNTSIADIAALETALGTDPGAPAGLAAYAAARERDIALRAGAIDAFNRVARSGSLLAHTIRPAGLAALHDLPPVRRALMRAGLGSAAD